MVSDASEGSRWKARSCALGAIPGPGYLFWCSPYEPREERKYSCDVASAVQHVREPPVKPGLTRDRIVFRVNRFAEHVRVPAIEPTDLSVQSFVRVSRQIVLALVPEFLAVRDGVRHAIAARLESVLADRLRVA